MEIGTFGHFADFTQLGVHDDVVGVTVGVLVIVTVGVRVGVRVGVAVGGIGSVVIPKQ